MHRSASGGDGGESIALPSEETGLAQRPSPCRYRMHFFFLLEQRREASVSNGRVPAPPGIRRPLVPAGWDGGGAAALRGHRQAAPAGRERARGKGLGRTGRGGGGGHETAVKIKMQ